MDWTGLDWNGLDFLAFSTIVMNLMAYAVEGIVVWPAFLALVIFWVRRGRRDAM